MFTRLGIAVGFLWLIFCILLSQDAGMVTFGFVGGIAIAALGALIQWVFFGRGY